MPATAGRVRMPADNRLSVSDSLRTNEIWQKSVGYDPYAPTDTGDASAIHDVEEKAKGLFALARLTGSSSSTTPGACRKCDQVGHLTYQCRNYIPLKNQKSTTATTSKAGSISTNLTSIIEADQDENDDLPSKKSRKHRRHRHKSKRRHRSPSSSDDSSSDDSHRRKKKHRKRHRRRSRSSSSDADSESLPPSERSSSESSHRHGKKRKRSRRDVGQSGRARSPSRSGNERRKLSRAAGIRDENEERTSVGRVERRHEGEERERMGRMSRMNEKDLGRNEREKVVSSSYRRSPSPTARGQRDDGGYENYRNDELKGSNQFNREDARNRSHRRNHPNVENFESQRHFRDDSRNDRGRRI